MWHRSRFAQKMFPSEWHSPFLQERFPVDGILSHGRCLPRKIRSGRIALEQIRSVTIPATNQQRNAERSNATGLRVLLHQRSNALHQLSDRDRFTIREEIVLGHFARLLHQQTIIRSHARVHHTDVVGNGLHFVNALFVVQNGFVFVFGGQNDTVRSHNADGRSASCYRSQSILDLDQLSRWTGEGKKNFNFRFSRKSSSSRGMWGYATLAMNFYSSNSQTILWKTYLKVVSEKL